MLKHITINCALALCCILASTQLAFAQNTPASKDVAAADLAEKFYYHVHYGKSRVANVNLFTGCTNTKAKPAALMAISKGLAEQIHSFSIRFDSMLRPRKTSTMLGVTSITEEGKTRVFRSRFRDENKSKITVKSRYKGTFKTNKIDLPYQAHDMLSWILDLRTKPTFKPKTTYTYHVWDGWKLFRLKATVRKTESVITPAGTFKAHRIHLERTRLHHKGKKRLSAKKKREDLGMIWLTKDTRRLPVAINFQAAVGNARIRLLKHTKKNCLAR